MKLVMALIAAGSMAIIGGCATMSKTECMQADWYEIGKKDGFAGENWQKVNKHAKSCKSVGIVPDQQRWEAGRQEGLNDFCIPLNAYKLATEGRYIDDICVGREITLMDQAQRYGFFIFEKKKERRSLESKQRKLKSDLSRLEKGELLGMSESEARQYRAKIPAYLEGLHGSLAALDYLIPDMDKRLTEVVIKYQYY